MAIVLVALPVDAPGVQEDTGFGRAQELVGLAAHVAKVDVSQCGPGHVDRPVTAAIDVDVRPALIVVQQPRPARPRGPAVQQSDVRRHDQVVAILIGEGAEHIRAEPFPRAKIGEMRIVEHHGPVISERSKARISDSIRRLELGVADDGVMTLTDQALALHPRPVLLARHQDEVEIRDPPIKSGRPVPRPMV